MSLEGAAAKAVEAALSAGASDADAWAEESTSRSIRVYGGEVESLSDAGGRGVGVRAFAGLRSGYAYGTDLSEEGVAEVARAAREAAEVADEDEFAGLPEDFGVADVDGLASPKLADWETARKVELALEIERAARAHEGVSQVENAVYSDAEGSVAFVNSRGFSASYSATQAWAYASAFAGEGADLMTGLGVELARDPGGLDAEQIGAEAVERALALVGARQPESRRCPVVLDAFVAASFINHASAHQADTPGNGRRALTTPAGADALPAAALLKRLLDALVALRADEAVDLTAVYLKAGFDRTPLLRTLADGAVIVGNDPHNQELGLCLLEDYRRSQATDRDRLLLACAKHTAGHRKYGDHLECYRRFAEAFALTEA